MAESTSEARVYVATETFATLVDGVPQVIHKGRTRVAEGHELVRNNPQYFEVVDAAVHFRVETATAEPGEKREATTKSSGPVADTGAHATPAKKSR